MHKIQTLTFMCLTSSLFSSLSFFFVCLFLYHQLWSVPHETASPSEGLHKSLFSSPRMKRQVQNMNQHWATLDWRQAEQHWKCLLSVCRGTYAHIYTTEDGLDYRENMPWSLHYSGTSWMLICCRGCGGGLKWDWADRHISSWLHHIVCGQQQTDWSGSDCRLLWSSFR